MPPVRPAFRPFPLTLLLPMAASAWRPRWRRPIRRNPGQLWRDPYDGNAHFSSALTLALALHQGDVIAFAAELARPSVSATVAGAGARRLDGRMTGPDLRWAILPATLGWVATLFGLAMLCVRSADPARAVLAAGVAVALAMASPGLARLGSDAMMELPGTALTVFALLAALSRPVPWRWLGVLLTLLALHKYNYWSMAVAAMALAAAGEILPWARCLASSIDRARLSEDAPLRGLAVVLALAALLLPAESALAGRWDPGATSPCRGAGLGRRLARPPRVPGVAVARPSVRRSVRRRASCPALARPAHGTVAAGPGQVAGPAPGSSRPGTAGPRRRTACRKPWPSTGEASRKGSRHTPPSPLPHWRWPASAPGAGRGCSWSSPRSASRR